MALTPTELFSLPQSEFRRVFYGLLFAELCKTSREFAPGVLSKAVNALYKSLDKLDVECFIIFTEWFAHHLSNFDYKWLWYVSHIFLTDLSGQSGRTPRIRYTKILFMKFCFVAQDSLTKRE